MRVNLFLTKDEKKEILELWSGMTHKNTQKSDEWVTAAGHSGRFEGNTLCLNTSRGALLDWSQNGLGQAVFIIEKHRGGNLAQVVVEKIESHSTARWYERGECGDVDPKFQKYRPEFWERLTNVPEEFTKE